MPSSVCNNLNQETERLFEENESKIDKAEDNISQIDEKIESCRRERIEACPPSPKTQKKSERILEKLKEQEYTQNELARYREILRSQLANRDWVIVEGKSMALFNENQDPAKESQEIQEYRKQLKEQLSIERKKIQTMLSQKA